MTDPDTLVKEIDRLIQAQAQGSLDTYPLYDARRNLLDQWVTNLGVTLRLDKAETAKILFDWVDANSEHDWLKVAAENDACDGSYGHGELTEFLNLATKAFSNAWGKQCTQSPVDTLLDQIEDLIDNYRDQA